MSLSKAIRHYWHDAYYAIAPRFAVELALRCRAVATSIDLHEPPPVLAGRLRLRFHLSLCQACENYFETSRALGLATRSYARREGSSKKLEAINKKLLKNYAAKK